MNIDIYKFLEQFNKEYKFLYDCESYVAGENEAVLAFDNLLESQASFIREFCLLRGDYITSDREAAAFMFALDNLTK